MKKTIVAAIFSVAFAASSSAFTASSSNLITGAAAETPIVDSSGTPIAVGAGVSAIGFFQSLDDAGISALGGGADFAGILADFVIFGTEQAGFANAFGAPGFFTHAQEASIPFEGNSPFEGNFLYTVIGNGATLADSSELAVWVGTTSTFEEENQLGLGTANNNVTPGEGTLLVGRAGGEVDLGVAQFSSTIQLASAIPEPSSFALLGLAGLGFLARRKR